MLKVALVVFGCFVAAVWILCGYLYFAPVDERPPGSIASAESGNASSRNGPAAPHVTGGVAGVISAMQPAILAPETAPGMLDRKEEKRREMSVESVHPAARDATSTAAPPRAQATGGQYSASGGYVLDADSVVIAPPTSADGPGSPAEQRRRTRLSMDISTIP